MAWIRRTLPQLIEQAVSDIEEDVGGTSARLRRSVQRRFAKALAGLVHLLYGYIANLVDYLHPYSAYGDSLLRWVSIWKMGPLPATAATGLITISGTNGKTLPHGSIWQRGDGLQYATAADATIVAGSASVTVTCTTTGVATDTPAGAKLTLVSPVNGIQSAATVGVDGLSGGADKESDDALRARWHYTVQNPDRGGADSDYVRWAKEVAGVGSVWPIRHWFGVGTVGLFFVCNDATIFPTAGEVQAVRDHLLTKIPSDMDASALYVSGPAPHTVDLTISLKPNTLAVQNAVLAELADVFTREGTVEKGDGKAVIPRTHIAQAISNAAGEDNHAMNLATDITPAKGALPVLGTVTFQAL